MQHRRAANFVHRPLRAPHAFLDMVRGPCPSMCMPTHCCALYELPRSASHPALHWCPVGAWCTQDGGGGGGGGGSEAGDTPLAPTGTGEFLAVRVDNNNDEDGTSLLDPGAVGGEGGQWGCCGPRRWRQEWVCTLHWQ
jgi:hypothetical protein